LAPGPLTFLPARKHEGLVLRELRGTGSDLPVPVV